MERNAKVLNAIMLIQRFFRKKIQPKNQSNQNQKEFQQVFLQFEPNDAEFEIDLDRKQRNEKRRPLIKSQNQKQQNLQNQENNQPENFKQPVESKTEIDQNINNSSRTQKTEENINLNSQQNEQNSEDQKIILRIAKNYIQQLKLKSLETYQNYINQKSSGQIVKGFQNQSNLPKGSKVNEQNSEDQKIILRIVKNYIQQLKLKSLETYQNYINQKSSAQLVKGFQNQSNQPQESKENEQNNSYIEQQQSYEKEQIDQDFNLSEIKQNTKSMDSLNSNLQIQEFNSEEGEEQISQNLDESPQDQGNQNIESTEAIYNFLKDLTRIIIQSKESPKSFWRLHLNLQAVATKQQFIQQLELLDFNQHVKLYFSKNQKNYKIFTNDLMTQFNPLSPYKCDVDMFQNTVQTFNSNNAETSQIIAEYDNKINQLINQKQNLDDNKNNKKEKEQQLTGQGQQNYLNIPDLNQSGTTQNSKQVHQDSIQNISSHQSEQEQQNRINESQEQKNQKNWENFNMLDFQESDITQSQEMNQNQDYQDQNNGQEQFAEQDDEQYNEESFNQYEEEQSMGNQNQNEESQSKSNKNKNENQQQQFEEQLTNSKQQNDLLNKENEQPSNDYEEAFEQEQNITENSQKEQNISKNHQKSQDFGESGNFNKETIENNSQNLTRNQNEEEEEQQSINQDNFEKQSQQNESYLSQQQEEQLIDQINNTSSNQNQKIEENNNSNISEKHEQEYQKQLKPVNTSQQMEQQNNLNDQNKTQQNKANQSFQENSLQNQSHQCEENEQNEYQKQPPESNQITENSEQNQPETKAKNLYSHQSSLSSGKQRDLFNQNPDQQLEIGKNIKSSSNLNEDPVNQIEMYQQVQEGNQEEDQSETKDLDTRRSSHLYQQMSNHSNQSQENNGDIQKMVHSFEEQYRQDSETPKQNQSEELSDFQNLKIEDNDQEQEQAEKQHHQNLQDYLIHETSGEFEQINTVDFQTDESLQKIEKSSKNKVVNDLSDNQDFQNEYSNLEQEIQQNKKEFNSNQPQINLNLGTESSDKVIQISQIQDAEYMRASINKHQDQKVRQQSNSKHNKQTNQKDKQQLSLSNKRQQFKQSKKQGVMSQSSGVTPIEKQYKSQNNPFQVEEENYQQSSKNPSSKFSTQDNQAFQIENKRSQIDYKKYKSLSSKKSQKHLHGQQQFENQLFEKGQFKKRIDQFEQLNTNAFTQSNKNFVNTSRSNKTKVFADQALKVNTPKTAQHSPRYKFQESQQQFPIKPQTGKINKNFIRTANQNRKQLKTSNKTRRSLSPASNMMNYSQNFQQQIRFEKMIKQKSPYDMINTQKLLNKFYKVSLRESHLERDQTNLLHKFKVVKLFKKRNRSPKKKLTFPDIKKVM